MKPPRALLATMLALVLAATADAQTLQPLDQLAVVDGNGKTVGKFLDFYQGDPSHVGVLLKANDLIFEVYATANGFAGTDANWDFIAFQSTDCSGQAFYQKFTDTPAVAGAAFVAVGAPDYTVYVPTGPPQQVTLLSMFDSTGTCTSVVSSYGFPVPVQAAFDLGTLFTPPFRLTTVSSTTSGAACCGDCNGDGQVTVDEILTSVNYALNGCPAQ